MLYLNIENTISDIIMMLHIDMTLIFVMSMIEMTNDTFAKSLYQTATQHTITIPYNTGWDMFIYNEGKEDMAPYYK